MDNGLYTKIPKHKLTDILQTLQAYTQVPINLLDSDGTLLMSFGEKIRYCELLKQYAYLIGECSVLQSKAGQRARDLGEAYIYSCHANLTHIAFPLIGGHDLLGSVILGPFLMDSPDSTFISSVAEKYNLSPTLSLELYDELTTLQVIPPPKVQLLKKMMDFMLSPLMPQERIILLENQEKIYQQSRINESIQKYKGGFEAPSTQFFYQKETELLTKVRTGNSAQVKGLLNDLIGYVLFSQGGNIESVRLLSIELATLLSRVAMDGGARADSILELNTKLLPALYQERDLDRLCYRLQEIAENFMDTMFYEKDKGNLHIRKALRFMADHYHEHLSLKDAAAYVQLSPSYFSTLFCEVVGTSFREHLCHIRIEESKQLLLSTDYSLTDIAVSVGFPDQSYFCKAFKNATGLSPRKYRQ